MADLDVTFKWQGVDTVLARMKQLDVKMQKSMARRAARAGMALVRDSARAKAVKLDKPGTRSAIWKNIVTQESRRGKRLGGILMRVGVRGGSITRKGVKRAEDGATPHWRHIELGTQFVQARSFMRSALIQNMGAVADTVAEELRNDLDEVGV